MPLFACRNDRFSPLQRRSMAMFGGLMILAVVMLAFVREAGEYSLVSRPLLIVLDLLPAFPIMLMIGVVSRYLTRETDEFIRLLVMQSRLWAIGTTMVADIVLAAFFDSPRAVHFAVMFNIDVFCIAAMTALSIQLRRAQ